MVKVCALEDPPLSPNHEMSVIHARVRVFYSAVTVPAGHVRVVPLRERQRRNIPSRDIAQGQMLVSG